MIGSTAPLPTAHSPEAAQAGIRAVFQVAERWGLTRPEMAALLGVRSTSTLDNWRRKAPELLSPDTLERISYLLHVYRSLHQLLPADQADAWVRRPNDAVPFRGRSALHFMLEGRVQNLLDTHRYLKGVASGGS